MLRCGSSPNLASSSGRASPFTGLWQTNDRVQPCSTRYSLGHTVEASQTPRAQLRRIAGGTLGGPAAAPAALRRPGGARGKRLQLSTVRVAASVIDESVGLSQAAKEQESSGAPHLGGGSGAHGRGPAWNKGLQAAESTKSKISSAQKRRWNKDPELRQRVSDKLKGRVPWNKGRKLSEDTRRKMSAAKLNHAVAKSTRNKMSKAHMGKTHTPETSARLSAKLAGQPKSASHRASIAASQRRRHAAARVLRAVEAVHRESELEGSLGTPNLPPSAGGYGYTPPPRGGGGGGGERGGSGAAVRRVSRTQLLDVFKGELREYRALQEELAPWTRAFEQRTGRKPRLRDVELTGIDWLLEKYRKYVVLRERVLCDTKNMRSMLDGARPDAAAMFVGADSGAASTSLPMNINATAAAGSEGAMKMAAALEYKRARSAAAAAAAASAAAAAPVDAVPSAGPLNGSGALGAVAGANGAAALLNGAGNGAANGAGNGAAVAGLGEEASTADAGPPPQLRAVPAAPTNAPPRVKMALAAALEYRKKQAAATAAKANAAAAAAVSRGAELAAAQQAAAQALLEAQDAQRSVRQALQVMSLDSNSALDVQGAGEPGTASAAGPSAGQQQQQPPTAQQLVQQARPTAQQLVQQAGGPGPVPVPAPGQQLVLQLDEGEGGPVPAPGQQRRQELANV